MLPKTKGESGSILEVEVEMGLCGWQGVYRQR